MEKLLSWAVSDRDRTGNMVDDAAVEKNVTNALHAAYDIHWTSGKWFSGQGFLSLPQRGISSHMMYRSPVPFFIFVYTEQWEARTAELCLPT